jgi:hypothetical protein
VAIAQADTNLSWSTADVDADEIAARMRSDDQFRRRALHDPHAVVAEHALDVPRLKAATRLLDHTISAEDDGWCEEHAAMFALIAYASRGD